MSGEPLSQLTKDDLEELLHTKVHSFTISPLTAPGENYGSTMLLVDATLLPDHKKISIAAKMVSEHPHVREAFHFRETMLKEIYAYVLVRPEFLAIQKEYNIPADLFLDVIPECYGACTSRGGGMDTPVDETAAILLENLKVSGFRLADRLVGLDLQHLEYVVTRLARFHATAVAIKIKKPDVFKDTVLKAGADFNRGQPPGEDDQPGPMEILDALADNPVISQHMDRIKASMEREHAVFLKQEPLEIREPFASLVHNDFWTNNMMFSYGESDGKNITGIKVFDFQMTSYGSPVTDLLFLIFSSRTLDVKRDDIDRLIKMYYKEFIKWLQLFNCDTTPFSYEAFLKEVEIIASITFSHAFLMLRISSVSESNAPDISEKSSIDKLFSDNSGFGEIYFKKVENLVKEFIERDWL